MVSLPDGRKNSEYIYPFRSTQYQHLTDGQTDLPCALYALHADARDKKIDVMTSDETFSERVIDMHISSLFSCC